MWYGKGALAYFFFHVYLEIERELKKDHKGLILKILDILRHDAEIISHSIDNQKLILKTVSGNIPLRSILLDYFFRTIIPSTEVVIEKVLITRLEDR